MDFLSFFRETENKRRRSKRIVINVLYFLAPVVLLATSFTNERIISECETIHEHTISLKKELTEWKRKCEQTAPKPDGEISRFQGQISRLERDKRNLQQEIDALRNASSEASNSSLSDSYRKQRDEAQEQLSSCRDQLAQSKRIWEDRVRKLKQELAAKPDVLSSGRNNTERLQNRIDQLENTNADLQNQLRRCCETGKPSYTANILPITQIPKAMIRTATKLSPSGQFQIAVNGQLAGYIITETCPN